MKLFATFLLFCATLTIVLGSKRPYTTPSPYGSYRLKQIKCSCSSLMDKYLYPNFTCYAKALSRDVTTANVYGMLKRDVNKVWAWGYAEYKYGTIYRTIITTKKVEGCAIVNTILDAGNAGNNPIFQVAYTYAKIMVEQYNMQRLWHKCPFKSGEYLDGYNVTVDGRHLPSILNQGDYRVMMHVYVDHPDNLICNNSLVASIISPIKDSFGKK